MCVHLLIKVGAKQVISVFTWEKKGCEVNVGHAVKTGLETKRNVTTVSTNVHHEYLLLSTFIFCLVFKGIQLLSILIQHA